MPERLRPMLVAVLAAFVWINFVSTQEGGMNAFARFATLHAISRDHSFAIDSYLAGTLDWSLSPKDGRHYSNKAPGAVLFALPAYLVIDRLAYVTDRLGLRRSDGTGLPDYFRKTATSFATQVLPCVLLAALLARFLLLAGVATEGILFFLLAFLFGNISSFFFNSFMGHGLAVVFLMGGLLCHLERRPALAALLFGWALLTDYSVGPVILLLALAALAAGRVEWRNRHFLLRSLAGALLPGVLWVWYHTRFFGGPLTLPISQESPSFQKVSEGGVLGVIGLLPSPEVVGKLLFGAERGLLPTQPWVLVGVVALPFLARRGRELAPFAWASVLSFFLLLYLNASFPLWHAGGTPGPRYLSPAMPLLAFFLALYWRWSPAWLRNLLWAGLGVALVFRLLVATGDMLPMEFRGLWGYYWDGLTQLRRGSEGWKLAAFLFGIGLAGIYYRLARSSTRPEAGTRE